MRINADVVCLMEKKILWYLLQFRSIKNSQKTLIIISSYKWNWNNLRLNFFSIQFEFRFWREMKLETLFLFFPLISASFSFLAYPFFSEDLVNKFLNTLEVDDSIDLSQMINGSDCNRECLENDSKICHFYFSLKYFQVMGG